MLSRCVGVQGSRRFADVLVHRDDGVRGMAVYVEMDGKSKAPTGFNEWATKKINIGTGCENDCVYCYLSGLALPKSSSEIPAHYNYTSSKNKHRIGLGNWNLGRSRGGSCQKSVE